MTGRWLSAALSLAALALVGACADVPCGVDGDCPSGKVCAWQSGLCVTPECTAHAQCGTGQVCEDHTCVAGCVNDGACAAGERCTDQRCLVVGGACGCPLAPTFCARDANPRSATSGADRCVPGAAGPGATLLFGSVFCSHCRALADATVAALSASDAPGGPPPLVFVQLPDIPVTPAEVLDAFAPREVPVVQDSAELGLTHAYGADWYHVVVVDGAGCLAGHWGPLIPSDLDALPGQELRAAWRDAAAGACPGASGPDPDAGPTDTADATSPDLPDPMDAADPSDVGPLPDDASPALDAAMDVEGGALDAAMADAGWLLADLCQVADTATPPAVGEPVPAFLCRDMNPSSATHLAGYSDVILKETVWIAYFGACT